MRLFCGSVLCGLCVVCVVHKGYFLVDVLSRDFVVFLALICSGGVSASCGLLCIVRCVHMLVFCLLCSAVCILFVVCDVFYSVQSSLCAYGSVISLE